MKTTLSLFLLSILLSTNIWAQSTDVRRLSEPVQETSKLEVFGANLEIETLNPVTLTEIVESEKVSNSVTLVTTVAEVCNKKGCFFVAEDGEYTARITFKDYGFFIPTDSQGKEVVLIGEFTETILSEEKAKHYAEDAGKDPEEIKGEQKEYSIVATSVVVPKSK